MFLMHASWPFETENKGKSQEVNSRFGSHLNDSMKLVKRELVQLKFTALCWHIYADHVTRAVVVREAKNGTFVQGKLESCPGEGFSDIKTILD